MKLLPLLPFERMAKRIRVRISKEALEELKNEIELYACEIAEKCVSLAKFCERRTILKKDVKFVIGEMYGTRNQKI